MKTRKIPSALPIYLAAAVWLIVSLIHPVYTLPALIVCAALSAAAFFAGRIIFPGREETVEKEPNSGDPEVDRQIREGRADMKKLRDYFENHRSRTVGDYVFSMMYEMNPTQVDESLILPTLRGAFRKPTVVKEFIGGRTGLTRQRAAFLEGYWAYVLNEYPEIEFMSDPSDESAGTVINPQSAILEFVLHDTQIPTDSKALDGTVNKRSIFHRDFTDDDFPDEDSIVHEYFYLANGQVLGDQHQQLQQVVVDRLAGGLDHEHVAAADGLVDGNRDLPVGKFGDHAVAHLSGQLVADGLGESGVGISCKDLDFSGHENLLAFSVVDSAAARRRSYVTRHPPRIDYESMQPGPEGTAQRVISAFSGAVNTLFG